MIIGQSVKGARGAEPGGVADTVRACGCLAPFPYSSLLALAPLGGAEPSLVHGRAEMQRAGFGQRACVPTLDTVCPLWMRTCLTAEGTDVGLPGL